MSKQRLKLIHCITPLHNGSGEGLGVIDRPVIRESITGYPYIQGSTIKGAIRAIAPASHGNVTIEEIFGPEKGSTTGLYQGCASFSDASLLLLPVQSLHGVFGWVTSPLILARLARWCDLSGDHSLRDSAASVAARAIAHERVLLSGTDLFYFENKSCLGGIMFTCVQGAGLPDTDTQKLAEHLRDALFDRGFWHGWFPSRLAVVSDADFVHLVRASLPVEANISINENGVTETSSLRYTEFLPAETVLAAFIAIDTPMKRGALATVDDALEFLDNVLSSKPCVQFGADETKGKGLVRIRPATAASNPDQMKSGVRHGRQP